MMNDLQQALNFFLKEFHFHKFKKFSTELTETYRSGGTLKMREAFLTYLMVRMPATYAAICTVLSQIPRPESILDLGAGPGTLFWACHSLWDKVPSILAIERESTFIDIGRHLGTRATWLEADFLKIDSFLPHEWIFFGYSLGEIEESTISPLLERCWRAALKGIILIEPGTPRGYQRMLKVRDHLIKRGGHIIAPCPHALSCPMKANDWCHFSVRLDRSSLHRKVKGAHLGYEDEKFSYLIVSKEPSPPPLARLIRPPHKHSGHTTLTLCTVEGIQLQTISKKNKERYNQSKKLKWGDTWMLNI